MYEIINRLRDLFSPTRVAAHLVDELLPDLVVAGMTLLAAWTAQTFNQAVIRYIVLTIGMVTALAQLGVDTASLLTSLGVLGLTIGFVARDTLSNVVSGLFIFWDRPFVISDLVEIDGKYGRVEDITMRSTRVVTVDGRMLAIPNIQTHARSPRR